MENERAAPTYLKVVGELSERIILEQMIKEPDPVGADSGAEVKTPVHVTTPAPQRSIESAAALASGGGESPVGTAEYDTPVLTNTRREGASSPAAASLHRNPRNPPSASLRQQLQAYGSRDTSADLLATSPICLEDVSFHSENVHKEGKLQVSPVRRDSPAGRVHRDDTIDGTRRCRAQGMHDWWSYLLNDDWLPDECIFEFKRRLAGYDRQELEWHRRAGSQIDRDFPVVISESGRELLCARGVMGETLLHSCILRVGDTSGDLRTRQCTECLAKYVIEICNSKVLERQRRRANVTTPGDQQQPNMTNEAENWMLYQGALTVDLVNMQYDLCHELTGEFCDRPDCPYAVDGRSDYAGESPLHMAIVFNLVDLVSLLLEHGADLHLRARGNFFTPGRFCYFGETVLNFAVSIGNLDMVTAILDEHLRRAQATTMSEQQDMSSDAIQLFDFVARVDSIGNSALHMCIVHRQMHVLDWLLQIYPGSSRRNQAFSEELAEQFPHDDVTYKQHYTDECRLWTRITGRVAAQHDSLSIDVFRAGIQTLHAGKGEKGQRVAEVAALRADPDGDGHITRHEFSAWFRGKWWCRELLSLRNSWGHTPLTLAALQGDPQVFRHVMRRISKHQWNFGPVVCLTVPLEQIDTLICEDLLPLGAPPARHKNKNFTNALECIILGQVESLATNSILVMLLGLKWDKWARRVFILSTIFHVALLVTLMLLSLQYMHAKKLWLEATPRPSDATLEEVQDAMALLHNLEIAVYAFAGIKLPLFLVDGASALMMSRIHKASLTQNEREVDEQLKQERAVLRDGSLLHRVTKTFRNKANLQLVTGCTETLESATIIDTGAFDVAHLDVFGTFNGITMILLVAHNIYSLLHPERYGIKSNRVPWLLVTAMPLAFLALFRYLTCASKSVGYLIIIIMRVFRKDITRYLLVWTLIAMGFSFGLSLMLQEHDYRVVDEADDTVIDRQISGSWMEVASRLLELYRVKLGEKPPWSKWDDENSESASHTLFYVLYSLSTGVILIRILISMFNETYVDASRNAEKVWRLERGRFILKMERRIICLQRWTLFWSPSLQNTVRNILWIGDTKWKDAAQPGIHEYTHEVHVNDAKTMRCT